MKKTNFTHQIKSKAKNIFAKKSYSNLAIALIYLIAIISFMAVFIFGINTDTSKIFFGGVSSFGFYLVILAIVFMLFEKASNRISWLFFWRKFGYLFIGILLYNFAYLFAKIIHDFLGLTR